MLLIVDPLERRYVKLPFSQSPTSITHLESYKDDYGDDDGNIKDNILLGVPLEDCTQVIVLTEDLCLIGNQVSKENWSPDDHIELAVYASKALMGAYACNQSQSMVIDVLSPNLLYICPIVDFHLLKGFVQSISFEESEENKMDQIADLIWQTALLVGAEYHGKSAPLLENIIILGSHLEHFNQEALQTKLEYHLPVSAFAGDWQPKKISLRTSVPAFYDTNEALRNDRSLWSFFGAAIAAKSIFLSSQ